MGFLGGNSGVGGLLVFGLQFDGIWDLGFGIWFLIFDDGARVLVCESGSMRRLASRRDESCKAGGGGRAWWRDVDVTKEQLSRAERIRRTRFKQQVTHTNYKLYNKNY